MEALTSESSLSGVVYPVQPSGWLDGWMALRCIARVPAGTSRRASCRKQGERVKFLDFLVPCVGVVEERGCRCPSAKGELLALLLDRQL